MEKRGTNCLSIYTQSTSNHYDRDSTSITTQSSLELAQSTTRRPATIKHRWNSSAYAGVD